MSQYQHGQYIELYFDADNHPEYVKGWVSLDEAKAALRSYFGDELTATAIRHTYAFWGVGCDEVGEPCQRLYDRDQPGRGRFQVTEVTVVRP